MNLDYFSFNTPLPWVFFLFVYVGFAYGALRHLRSRRAARQRAIEDQNESLESKLRLLGESASRAGSLAKQITIEIDAMTTAADNAKEDAENAQKLAELSETEREAVAAMVREELGGQLQGKGKRDLQIQIGLSSFFFILGIVVSVTVAKLG